MPAISPLHAAFGEALRQLRGERAMSQEAVALDAGLNRGYYSGIERGVRNVALANVAKIAAALDVPASDIFLRAETILAAAKPSRRRSEDARGRRV